MTYSQRLLIGTPTTNNQFLLVVPFAQLIHNNQQESGKVRLRYHFKIVANWKIHNA